MTGASSDASGVTGDLTLDLKTGTDDNSTKGTRTSLMALEYLVMVLLQ